MCVAVVVESREGPKSEEMWRMDESNPHGIGLAWADGEVIRYRKGVTWKQATELLKVIPRPALLHFRWATHGGKAPHLSHPFPLGPRALLSRKLKGTAPAVLIHNGVWNEYLSYAPLGIDVDKWSDTAVAAYAAHFDESVLDGVHWCTAVGRAAGAGRMDVTTRGDWTEHNGNVYSNMSWQPSSKMFSFYGDYLRTRPTRSWSPTGPGDSVETYTAFRDRASTPLNDDLPVTTSTVVDIPELESSECTTLEELGITIEPRWRPDGKLTSAYQVSEWLDEYEAHTKGNADE